MGFQRFANKMCLLFLQISYHHRPGNLADTHFVTVVFWHFCDLHDNNCFFGIFVVYFIFALFLLFSCFHNQEMMAMIHRSVISATYQYLNFHVCIKKFHYATNIFNYVWPEGDIHIR